METEITTSEFYSRGKAIVEQIVTEEINKSKRARLRSQSQSGIRVGMLTILVRSCEIEKL